MTLEPFPHDIDEETCPKCNSYQLVRTYAKHMQGQEQVGEMLVWECEDCEFKWMTECADAHDYDEKKE